jgi:hypothetical protein
MNQFYPGYNIEQNQAKLEIIEKLKSYKETYGPEELEKLLEEYLLNK